MVVKNTREFKTDISNIDILNAIRRTASPDYQHRIPDATKANVHDTIQNLMDNRPFWNEFQSALVNRIGLEIFKSNSWRNPLSAFKIGQLEFGDTIEEIMTGLIEARVYDPAREYLEKDIFGTNRVETQVSYHKVNRKNYYPMTVNEPMLKQAFVNTNGLSSYISQLMEAPATSDNLDEFLLTTSLIAEMDAANGFFNVQVPDISDALSTDEEAKVFLRRMREKAGVLPFVSRFYNAAGMPVFANPDDLVLLVTPEAQAAIDVNALAAAFNVEKADLIGRTVVIPQENFGIEGAQAVLTTRDFFVIADQVFETTSQFNPVGLSTNYFLHHWQVISLSRFAPAILFSTREGDVITLNTPDITSVSKPETYDFDHKIVTDVARGMVYGVEALGIASSDKDNVNTQVTYELEGNESDRTYITQNGTLYVGADEPSGSLTVHATSAYIDPSDTDAKPQTNSATLTVSGDVLQLWPNARVIDEADAEAPDVP